MDAKAKTIDGLKDVENGQEVISSGLYSFKNELPGLLIELPTTEKVAISGFDYTKVWLQTKGHPSYTAKLTMPRWHEATAEYAAKVKHDTTISAAELKTLEDKFNEDKAEILQKFTDRINAEIKVLNDKIKALNTEIKKIQDEIKALEEANKKIKSEYSPTTDYYSQIDAIVNDLPIISAGLKTGNYNYPPEIVKKYDSNKDKKLDRSEALAAQAKLEWERKNLQNNPFLKLYQKNIEDINKKIIQINSKQKEIEELKAKIEALKKLTAQEELEKEWQRRLKEFLDAKTKSQLPSAAAQAEWDKFYSALLAHERGHENYAREFTANLLIQWAVYLRNGYWGVAATKDRASVTIRNYPLDPMSEGEGLAVRNFFAST